MPVLLVGVGPMGWLFVHLLVLASLFYHFSPNYLILHISICLIWLFSFSTVCIYRTLLLNGRKSVSWFHKGTALFKLSCVNSRTMSLCAASLPKKPTRLDRGSSAKWTPWLLLQWACRSVVHHLKDFAFDLNWFFGGAFSRALWRINWYVWRNTSKTSTPTSRIWKNWRSSTKASKNRWSLKTDTPSTPWKRCESAGSNCSPLSIAISTKLKTRFWHAIRKVSKSKRCTLRLFIGRKRQLLTSSSPKTCI